MSNELSDIIITIDTREQNQKRIKAVETWGELHGAIVEHSKLELCDYRIMGDFRGIPVNIGIEAKGLSDFCSCDYEDLKRKLFDSFEIFEEVALFIESANYSFLNEGFGKSAIINSAVRDGSANVCNLAVLEGCCSTLPLYGIHVRQLRSESQFPYSIENLLTYCIHDHDIVKQSPEMYLRQYKHTLKSFMTSIQVKKAITCYPNLHWLCSASEESYKGVFGKVAGTKHYNFIRNPELMTDAWRNNKFPDGTDVLQCPHEGKPCSEVNAYQCIGEACKHHPDNNVSDKIKDAIHDYLIEKYPHALSVEELYAHFNIEQGDDDKESFLEYIKTLAWEKKITSTSSGLFQSCNDKTLQSLKVSKGKVDKLEIKEQEITSRNGKPLISNVREQPHYSRSANFLDNDKTDGAGIVSRTSSQEPNTKGMAPVPSELNCNNVFSILQHSNHPGTILEPPLPPQKPGDTQGAPILFPSCPVVQEKDSKGCNRLPSTKHQPSPVTPDKELDLFGKDNPDWKAVDEEELKLRNKDIEFEEKTKDFKMSIRKQLEVFLEKPHTQQECVDKLSNFSKGAVSDHIFHMKREGFIVEFDNKTLVITR